MAKVTPTTKSRYDIERLLGVPDCMCVYSIANDPTCTHALYHVSKSSLDYWKNKLKEIGAKYLAVRNDSYRDQKVIYFALEITPQEALEVKMREDREARFKQAYESKLSEIEVSIILKTFGATSSKGKQNFAKWLLDGTLDPLVPFESYVFVDEPADKDERRICDIIKKANEGYDGCVGMVTTQIWKMEDLARRMNKSITDEDKRARRRAACLKYGLNFLAKCFMK